jgi:hypothetical protein
VNAKKIAVAKAEAKRFLQKVKEYEEASCGCDYSGWMHPVQSGAMRRLSMDLTRALADMRKPN